MMIMMVSGSEDGNHHHDNQDGVMYKPGARFIDEATGSTLVCTFVHVMCI